MGLEESAEIVELKCLRDLQVQDLDCKTVSHWNTVARQCHECPFRLVNIPLLIGELDAGFNSVLHLCQLPTQVLDRGRCVLTIWQVLSINRKDRIDDGSKQ